MLREQKGAAARVRERPEILECDRIYLYVPDLEPLVGHPIAFQGRCSGGVRSNVPGTRAYLMQDPWGGRVLVQTRGKIPEKGRLYLVRGTVTKDARSGRLFVVEKTREGIAESPPLLLPSGSASAQGIPPALWILGGGGAAAVLFLALVLWTAIRRARR